MFRNLIAAILSLSLMVVVPAVHAAPKGADKAGQSVSQGPRRHIANIVFAGLAGAVLGLSTLSFYGRPQDRLSNIAVGFAIGVIGGTIFTTYKAAAEPKDFYTVRDPYAEGWKLAESGVRDFTSPTPKTGFTISF